MGIAQLIQRSIDTLRDKVVGGAKAAATATIDRFVPDLPLSHQQQRIGGNLTPSQVSQIYREADQGIIYRIVDLGNESRQKDCTLESILETRENSLAPLGYTIVPWRERDEEPTDDAIGDAHLVEDALGRANGEGQDMQGLTDTISHLQGSIYHGHATSEIAWIRQGNWMMPKGFWPIGQRRFEFREIDGRLVFNDTFSVGHRLNGIDLTAEKPGEFITHLPRVNGDIRAREGLARCLIWAALFRNWAIADWIELGELTYKPWRIGKYPGGKNKTSPAGKTDREDLIDVMRRMTTSGIAAIRDDMEIDLKGFNISDGAKGVHKLLADFMGAEMAKAVLGQTLTVEAGERGARSLGEVHDRVRKDRKEYDAISQAATLMRDLIRWIIWLNRGPETPLPLFFFNTDDAIDMSSFSDGLKKLVEAGAQIPVGYPNDKLGIPMPEQGDMLLGGSSFGGETSEQEESKALWRRRRIVVPRQLIV